MNTVEVVEDGIYQAEYDSTRDQPSLAVVAAVAAVDNSDPVEMNPLHNVIDTGALNELFSATTSGGQRNGHISFSYEGYEVTVFSEGVIKVNSVENT
ncbi:hypothetical protein HTZ84_09875 [Haloterrigena sp. SYSU A558-1]|uniref:Halobacterial output domain-containing protein n=1 Tax=Haloterrigena gelatinilytica TaxID=2741724 RepID=A0ABX2LHL9_9EURY|nr:HalOD1 output domain-containing protein [Haloterrigena gelatinilytica]NUC72614.1 hypothetical protein [Haloterrigena gelatinilytica]